MGLFSLFKKKPVHEKIKGDIAAKSGFKPIATLQVIEDFNAMYIYLIDNECIVYEIGKHDCSNVYIYGNAELAYQGALDTIEYYRNKMDCIVIDHGNDTNANHQEAQVTQNKNTVATVATGHGNSMLTELGISSAPEKAPINKLDSE